MLKYIGSKIPTWRLTLKNTTYITATLLLILLMSACAPQTTEASPTPSATETTPPNNNQVYLDFVANHQESVRISLLDACQNQYPELNIIDVRTGNPTSYVADQNPSTFTYEPIVEIILGDPNGVHYFVEFNNGALTVKNSDQTTITNQNIINLVVTEAVKLSSGLSHFQATVSIENTAGGVFIKQSTCSLN